MARGEARSSSHPRPRRGCERARALVDRVAAGDAPAYGINTGFGTLAEVRIDKKDLRELQRNLILSHAAGVGHAAPRCPRPARCCSCAATCSRRATRASGRETLQLALDMLNRGVIPVVPERGSVGASGDLAPLAHLALVLIGEGEAFFEGERLPGRAALDARGPRAGGARGQGGPRAGQRHPGDVRGGRARPAPRPRRSPRLADVAGRDDAGGAARAATSRSSPRSRPCARTRARRRVRRAPARAPRAARELVETPRELRQGAGPLLAALHAPGARRRARRPRLRAAHARDRGQQRHRQPAGLRRDEERIVSGGNFHGQPVSLALDVLAMALHPARRRSASAGWSSW